MREMLQPVTFRHITLGGFWKQQIKRITEHWLPHCVRQLEPGGGGQELRNLVHAAHMLRGRPPGPYRGKPWSDAYVYNTLEAMCLALAVAPAGDAALARAQAFLRGKIEQWIPMLLAAQDPDGYIHSYHTVNALPHFQDAGAHEFYVMGYFIEAGIAHFQCTGGADRRLYDAALRCADVLDAAFGPPPKRTWKNEHPGIEYALFRLARCAEDVAGPGAGDRYARLATYLVDHHHTAPPSPPSTYNQSDRPATDLREAAGHAVRATYFYTAMADIALLRDDSAYRRASGALWDNVVHRKYYLTGAVGALHEREAFGAEYDLPNNGYCESCAGCGLSFWSERMHRLHGDAHYRDVQERVLCNHVLGAIGWEGKDFFYQNPLASDQARQPWHPCPCCVGNIPRALLGLKDAIYSTNATRDTLYVSHFAACTGTVDAVAGTTLEICQETDYPWQGVVRLTLHPAAPAAFTLKLRIPNRTESALYTAVPDRAGRFEVRVNGRRRAPTVKKGYIAIRRTWRAGDRVDLILPLEVQRVSCDERVAANRGRVALQRGPLVYVVEDVDHPVPAEALKVLAQTAPRAAWDPDAFGGLMWLRDGGITAIPYYLRLNRGGASQVWTRIGTRQSK